MHPLLSTFIRERCATHPGAVIPLADLMREFRATLPASALESWRRGRVLAELRSAGYQVGIIDRVYHVAGLSLAREWREQGGQLVSV